MMPSDYRNNFSPSMRPTSDILKTRSVYSEHSEKLNNWYEDLQRYEKSLEDMAAVTLDQNFKEELQHVDQWFCYLSIAERTATIYTLLQHSSPVQTRFFMNILQQQKRDSILTLSDQDTSPFYQAEKEASQRLMNMIPFKTGNNPLSTPKQPSYDRHSIAFGDMDDFNMPGLYKNQTGSNQQLNVPRHTHSTTLVSPRTSVYPRSSARSRPSSDIDSSPDVFSTWRSSMVGSIGDRNSIIEQKSLDLFGDGNDSYVSMASGGSGFQPWGLPSNLPFSDSIHYHDKPLPHIGTVKENDEQSGLFLDQHYQQHRTPPNQQPVNTKIRTTATTTAALSSTAPLSPTSAFTKYYSASRTTTSPASTPTNYNRSKSSTSKTQKQVPNKSFGTFLDPKDAYPEDHDYYSDHSDTSQHSRQSTGTLQNGQKYHSSRQQGKSKEKKTVDSVVDMELLNDVPGWFRSLRLHKYNAIFESMRWQDIIRLSDQDLQTKGVAALGARRKMLKVFETVRDHCTKNDIPY
ncbi:uncharacterized protein BX664DRAFT_324037 [Halteromyces radiatus]|uniref:uncharacterized protein n=1 Tax=Halteromyces radiatus TaxID=101107 RepID=UPI00221ED24A|nr:uncharacterized protein BX664DRAFT_324037 [Halteromyces radiatus]KAI8096455.1 hypothetical protein BX664DRAFT_324037 [Halteromyces radiatus]